MSTIPLASNTLKPCPVERNCMTVTIDPERPMTKKPKTDDDLVTVKIRYSAYKKIRGVCGLRDINLSDYISEHMEEAASRDLDELNRPTAKKKPPKSSE